MCCPQDRVLSTLIWLLIADTLLGDLEKAKIHSAGLPTVSFWLFVDQYKFLGLTLAISTTPTAVWKALFVINPLHVHVEAEATAKLFRLKSRGQFILESTATNSCKIMVHNVN